MKKPQNVKTFMLVMYTTGIRIMIIPFRISCSMSSLPGLQVVVQTILQSVPGWALFFSLDQSITIITCWF